MNPAFRVRVQSLPSSSLVTQFFMKESNWSDTNKFSKIQLTNSILKRHNLFSISFSHWVDQAEVGFHVFLCFALLLEHMCTIYIGLARTAYGLPHAKPSPPRPNSANTPESTISPHTLHQSTWKLHWIAKVFFTCLQKKQAERPSGWPARKI